MLLKTVADRQVVVAVSDEAAGCGIRTGMTLTQARALDAGVRYAEVEPERDARALEALARWMTRFTPVVALAQPEEETSCGRGLFLDVSGCDRVFGGFANIVRQVSGALSRMGVSARVAVAPTPGAAWALADAGRDGVVVEPHQVESALDPLPVESLRVGEEIARGLRHLGLCTIGQVMHLPREVLPARFGPALLRRIDQATGRTAEPLTPLEYRPPVEGRLDLDGTVTSLESVWTMFRSLAPDLVEQLSRRGQGARRLDVQLLRAHAPPIGRSIFFSRPSRDPVNWFNLFRCALDDLKLPPKETSRLRGRVPDASRVRGTRLQNGWGQDASRATRRTALPGRGGTRSEREVFTPGIHASPRNSRTSLQPRPSSNPTRDSRALQPHLEAEIFDEGFCGLRIGVPLCERISGEQISLLGGEQFAGRAELDHLIERLRVKLGDGSVVRPEPVEAYVPELAWRSVPPDPSPTRPPPAPPADSPAAAPSARPLCLYPVPLEIRVMVTPSEDAEGDPAGFTLDGQFRPVVFSVGPERITGQWWHGHDKTRDYFDVSDPAGRRFWIFRVTQTARWYLHGSFA